MGKKISAKYFATDWTSGLADRYSDNWEKGVEIVKDRFESRFLNPAEALIKHTDKEIRVNSGFLIMSIDCLLIETLNQFYLGLKKTTDKYYNRNLDNRFKWNWQAFRDFFHHSTHFPDFKANDILVKFFFEEIRCGLLHQAESKINSLINIKNKKMVQPIIDGRYEQGMVINRNLFHQSLRKEFDKYIADLNNPESKNIFDEFLRDKCYEKMKNICD